MVVRFCGSDFSDVAALQFIELLPALCCWATATVQLASAGIELLLGDEIFFGDAS